MNSEYAYWLAKLAGEDPDPPEDRTQLPCGFWRLRRGEPLAVWIDGETGNRIGLVGFGPVGKPMSDRYMETMAESGGFGIAVPEDAYRAAFDAGRWPDTDAVVAAQVPPSPRRGHNNPPDDSDPAVIEQQIDDATTGADEYKTIADDETAARAQSLRSRLLELSGAVVKHHKAEKQPFLDGGRDVDRKWFPLRDKAKAAADAIRAALSAFETAKARKEAEVARARQPAAQPANDPVPITSAPTQIRGGYGRPGVVRTVEIVTGFSDQDATYRHFRGHPDLTHTLVTLAQKAVDAGGQVPGVTVEQQRKVS